MHIHIKKDEEKILESIGKMHQNIKAQDAFDLKAFRPADTLIVLVDVINGFIDQGVYSNPLAASILDRISSLVQSDLPCIALSDAHTESSIEFESHPVHGLKSSTESNLNQQIVDDVDIIFEKDSINGFFAEGFKSYFDDHKEIKHVIVVGLVTDICVLNFCLTLKAYCNQMKRPLDIHLPIDGVETFDLPGHSATLMNLVSSSMMMANGIKLYN